MSSTTSRARSSARCSGGSHGWLRPGGHLTASFGASDLPGWYGEAIGGLETYFSGYEPPVTLGLVRDAGLEIVRDELETIREPEGDATFLWVLARRPE